jgi:hypothetical protein
VSSIEPAQLAFAQAIGTFAAFPETTIFAAESAITGTIAAGVRSSTDPNRGCDRSIALDHGVSNAAASA